MAWLIYAQSDERGRLIVLSFPPTPPYFPRRA